MDCVLDIVRESSGMLCSSLPMLLLITLVLIFPVSSITLSQVTTNTHLAGQLSAFLTRRFLQAGVRLTSITTFFFTQLSEAFLFQALCFPVILTLFLLAKVAVFYILSCHQRGTEVSVMGFLEEGPRAWSRVAATYLWGCAVVLILTAMAILLSVAGSLVANLIKPDGSDSWVCLVLESGSAVVFVVLVLAPLAIAMNLSTVVAGMEERSSGAQAFLRALTLLKHQKLQPALLLFLVTGIGIIIMEFAFHCRVLAGGAAAAAPSLSFMEAPFLVFAHSFLVLFDIVMSFAFYHACEAEANVAADTCCRAGKHDEDEEEDHFSICVHIVEQQCRRILYPSSTDAATKSC